MGDVGNNEWHNPVMVEEVKTSLVIDPDGVYIDGTIGGGGHAAAILESLSSMQQAPCVKTLSIVVEDPVES